jgi:hypothetical protein
MGLSRKPPLCRLNAPVAQGFASASCEPRRTERVRVSAVAASTARRSGTSLGSRILLIPGLNPIKEWAYAGAIITYVSATLVNLWVPDSDRARKAHSHPMPPTVIRA